MIMSILLASSLILSFIFKGYFENIFIVLATIAFYKQIIIDRNYKSVVYTFIISFIGVNIFITFGLRNYISFKDVQPGIEKEETLVLLVSEGEDRSYNLKERATEVYYKEGYKSLFNGVVKLHNYKNYYSKLGSSDFKTESEEIVTKLEYQLDDSYIIENTYLYSEPYFENTIEEAVSQGYKNIIICPLFMTEGKDYEIFQNRYEKLNLISYNLTNVQILDSFYKSNNLALIYKNDILNKVKESESGAGVVLIGLQEHNNLEQDILFREKVKEYIEYEQKDIDIKIKLPLLENNKKDIIKSAEELLEYGIDTLYVALPTSIIDNMYTKSLVDNLFNNLDMGETKFYYVDPHKKIDSIVDELFTRISLMSK